MNEFTDTIAAHGPAAANTVTRGRGRSIYLPTRIYEALPAAYVSVGMLFVLGAVYLGVGHGIGYLAVGLTSVFGGLRIHIIRQKARSSNRQTSSANRQT